jgi:cell division protein FtsB
LGGSESMHAESRLERQVRDLTAENKRLKMRIAELESTAGS